MRKKIKAFLLFISIIFLVIVISNYAIESYARNKTYDAIADIPKNKVGLVLGTSKFLQNGNVNLYFKYRIDATVALFKEHKIDFVLVSGDNSTTAYDEPTDFKEELIKRGIPEEKIFLDYAGFRTLDSVIRAKEIFGQEELTIVSQEFHNERAVYLAGKNDIQAIGFNARDVSGRYGLKVRLREYLARTKVFLDILFRVEPKFLGEKIEIR